MVKKYKKLIYSMADKDYITWHGAGEKLKSGTGGTDSKCFYFPQKQELKAIYYDKIISETTTNTATALDLDTINSRGYGDNDFVVEEDVKFMLYLIGGAIKPGDGGGTGTTITFKITSKVLLQGMYSLYYGSNTNTKYSGEIKLDNSYVKTEVAGSTTYEVNVPGTYVGVGITGNNQYFSEVVRASSVGTSGTYTFTIDGTNRTTYKSFYGV